MVHDLKLVVAWLLRRVVGGSIPDPRASSPSIRRHPAARLPSSTARARTALASPARGLTGDWLPLHPPHLAATVWCRSHAVQPSAWSPC